ncbi:MAG: hypothetical protein IPM64_14270 [Phycisphaerales bacterium]|nr:hypothetical protein [Phycisphaerales bacterium]
MDTTIKCSCSHCGAKYRLPVEAQGRSARCKQCGEKFDIPKQNGLEDSILSWLTEPAETEEPSVSQPRVISVPAAGSASGDSVRPRGIIRQKSSNDESRG